MFRYKIIQPPYLRGLEISCPESGIKPTAPQKRTKDMAVLPQHGCTDGCTDSVVVNTSD